MADRSKIEWTDATWNPIRARNRVTGRVGWHCEHLSPACANCYAEGFNARLGTGLPFKPGHRADVEIFLDETALLQPLRWRRPRMIFPGSMTDLFAYFVTDAMLDRIFAVMALCPQHTFQVLTKRSARMRAYLSDRGFGIRLGGELMKDARGHVWAECLVIDLVHRLTLQGASLPNVWLGVSAEDQARADERREDLKALAAAGWTTFASYEPALGPVNWTGWEFLRLLISGGESGRAARASHPDWHRGARDFCLPRGIAYFFKQWGEWAPSSPEEAVGKPRSGWFSLQTQVGRMPKPSELYPTAGAAFVARVGKKAAGRLLDGVKHDRMPGRSLTAEAA